MTSGGSCRSPSIITTTSPLECSSAAVSAAWWPKLRDSVTTFTRSSAAAIPSRTAPVPSRLPSSTITSSNGIPSSAATTRAWNFAAVSSSSCIGAATDSSAGSRAIIVKSETGGRSSDSRVWMTRGGIFLEMVDERALEGELAEIGRVLAAAMPVTRNPLKAIDEKAMDLASADAELKAALFRFVDVVPACRSLEDLARHLTGFLGEVEEPTAPIGVAMRMGNTRPGRAALGAAAAAGVRRMAHRVIVGADPKAGLGGLRGPWKDGVASSVDLLGKATVTQAEAQRYADRCADALDTLAAAARGWPDRPQLES